MPLIRDFRDFLSKCVKRRWLRDRGLVAEGVLVADLKRDSSTVLPLITLITKTGFYPPLPPLR